MARRTEDSMTKTQLFTLQFDEYLMRATYDLEPHEYIPVKRTWSKKLHDLYDREGREIMPAAFVAMCQRFAPGCTVYQKITLCTKVVTKATNQAHHITTRYEFGFNRCDPAWLILRNRQLIRVKTRSVKRVENYYFDDPTLYGEAMKVATEILGALEEHHR